MSGLPEWSGQIISTRLTWGTPKIREPKKYCWKECCPKIGKIGSLIGHQSQWITKIANFCKNEQFLAPENHQPYSFGAWKIPLHTKWCPNPNLLFLNYFRSFPSCDYRTELSLDLISLNNNCEQGIAEPWVYLNEMVWELYSVMSVEEFPNWISSMQTRVIVKGEDQKSPLFYRFSIYEFHRFYKNPS